MKLPNDLSEWWQLKAKGEYPSFPRKTALREALSYRPEEGMIAEFGVYKGVALKVICESVGCKPVFAFDSFEGLPENWNRGPDVYSRNHFKIDERRREWPSNAWLIKGWFSDTIKEFKRDTVSPFAFIHIDCDLYSSCVDILKGLNDRIVPGTILVFDELVPLTKEAFNKYTKWEEGEAKALKEWLSDFNREVELLLFGDTYQVAFKVIR